MKSRPESRRRSWPHIIRTDREHVRRDLARDQRDVHRRPYQPGSSGFRASTAWWYALLGSGKCCEWSPAGRVRRAGDQRWGHDWKTEAAHRALPSARACAVHGRAHVPAQDVADPPGFWGALGCACWAF
jgi:hypothetical protein